MADAQQKRQEEIGKHKELRDTRRREKAKKNTKRYSTGRNKGRMQQSIKDVKNLAKNATPLGIFSLLFQMKPFSDWMYGLAIIAAILKDLFDFLETTGILYGLIIIVTLLVSIFIAMMMILGGFTNGTGRAQQKMIRSWLVLLGGTTVEMFFGINFLPIETMTVVLIYILMLSSRKQEEKNRKLSATRVQESYA